MNIGTVNRTPPVGASQANRQSAHGIRTPDFVTDGASNVMYTKTAPSMSDDEHKQVIRELAWKDAAAGKFHDRAKPERLALERSFVSAFSPDRRGIISNALSFLSKKLPSLPRTPNATFDFANNFFNGRVSLANGRPNYLEVRGADGQTLATFSNGRWSMVSTSAENARHSEFAAIYNDAWREWQGAKTNAGPGASAAQITESVREIQEMHKLAREQAGAGASAAEFDRVLSAIWSRRNLDKATANIGKTGSESSNNILDVSV